MSHEETPPRSCQADGGCLKRGKKRGCHPTCLFGRCGVTRRVGVSGAPGWRSRAYRAGRCLRQLSIDVVENGPPEWDLREEYPRHFGRFVAG
jgi:hypothetical protein